MLEVMESDIQASNKKSTAPIQPGIYVTMWSRMSGVSIRYKIKILVATYMQVPGRDSCLSLLHVSLKVECIYPTQD